MHRNIFTRSPLRRSLDSRGCRKCCRLSFFRHERSCWSTRRNACSKDRHRCHRNTDRTFYWPSTNPFSAIFCFNRCIDSHKISESHMTSSRTISISFLNGHLEHLMIGLQYGAILQSYAPSSFLPFILVTSKSPAPAIRRSPAIVTAVVVYPMFFLHVPAVAYRVLSLDGSEYLF